MSSILTNNSAMVALQTLKSVNNSMSDVQSQISTGKKVATAKDNSAVWAISKVMESDVQGFETISEGLSLGESTVAVARNASETVTDLLTQMKDKIVSAQEEGVDRAKIQTDIDALRDQIESVVGAAQFNGVNLIDGSSSDSVNVLSSLDRASDGTVSSSHIEVLRQDLSIQNTGTASVMGTTAANDGSLTVLDPSGTPVNGNTATAITDGNSLEMQITGVYDGASYRVTLSDSGADDQLGERVFEYVASASDSAESVAANLNTQIANFMAATGDDSYYSVTRDGDTLTFTNTAGGGGGDLTLTSDTFTDGTAGVQSGGLGNLASIDVTTEAGATSALTSIETMIETSINAASAFGSVQGRIETQSTFVSELTDSLKSGIGSLVDADMEETSARLQALQVQQQLSIQAMSIANQAPQALLSLFG